MSSITLGGNPISLLGNLPSVGSTAPDFELVTHSLEKITLESFVGKSILLNIVPSLDTPICVLSAKNFQQQQKDNIVFLTVSRDTPFAQQRACASENIENIITGSDLSHKFGQAYQCEIITGPLAYLLSRAVVVIDKNKVIQYTEQVPEIKQEPNYQAALDVLARI